jgi:hypothetical protein
MHKGLGPKIFFEPRRIFSQVSEGVCCEKTCVLCLDTYNGCWEGNLSKQRYPYVLVKKHDECLGGMSFELRYYNLLSTIFSVPGSTLTEYTCATTAS